MVEKRKFTRFPLEAEIRWKRVLNDFDDPAEPTPHMGHTRDMSAGGLCIDMDSGISTGDMLLLEIKISQDRTIYSKGRVAWVNPLARIKGWTISSFESGVELLNLSSHEKTELDDFVARSFQS